MLLTGGVGVENENILSLIERSKTGDSKAFSELYSLYANEMYRFSLYMMGNNADAEDAMQEAIFSAWRNIHTLKENTSFKVWIFRILSNRCKTELMKRNKAPDILPIEEYEFLVDDATLDGFNSTELKEALQSLTPPDGQIIILSIIGGFKSWELAEIYNMEASTVRSRQKRALEKLRNILS
jgi:RNA polymerase sigma-70 factor (ECF subfamily)